MPLLSMKKASVQSAGSPKSFSVKVATMDAELQFSIDVSLRFLIDKLVAIHIIATFDKTDMQISQTLQLFPSIHRKQVPQKDVSDQLKHFWKKISAQ